MQEDDESLATSRDRSAVCDSGVSSDKQAPSLDRLFAAMRVTEDGAEASIDESWMQGRTAYGGVSAALALAAVQARYPDAPPLRSAQISFIGPVGGTCHITTRLLRRSKSSLFVDSAVSGAAGHGTSGLFIFSHERESHLDHNQLVIPTVPPPDALQSIPAHEFRPGFSDHFDMRPVTGPRFPHAQERAELTVWVRYSEPPQYCHPALAVLALSDSLPPAALALFRQFGPISSSVWQVNMLTATPHSTDGWWLLSSTSNYARAGFSVQEMRLWNSAGEIIACGSQGVALYC